MIENDRNNPKIREDRADFYLSIGFFEESKRSLVEAISIYSDKFD